MSSEPAVGAQTQDSEQQRLWYFSSSDDEGPWHGGFFYREDAVSAGRDEYEGEDFFVVWAVNSPIRLADWIEADRTLEKAEDSLADSDRVNSEFDDGGVFDATPEQENDLIARLKRACDEWQGEHGLVFSVNTFSRMGKPEMISASEKLES
jgi:hypothetical protein